MLRARTVAEVLHSWAMPLKRLLGNLRLEGELTMGKGAGFLVGIFYPIVVLFAVLLLAAVQMRSSSGAAFDTWRQSYNANRDLSERQLKKRQELRELAFKNTDEMNFTSQCLKAFNVDGTLVGADDQQWVKEAKNELAAGKKWHEADGKLRCFMRGFFSLQFDLQYFEAKRDEIASDLADLKKAIDATNEQYLALIQNRQEFLAFHEMEKGGSWYLWLIAVMHYNLMVLLLVMSMGALGGMARLLREYGDPSRSNPQPKDYFFIPLIGLVVAIGGYVLAKTGLLLLSSSKDETSLSPFMVSLVGLISGLMVKDVIDAIARAGSKIVNEEKPNAGQTRAVAGTAGGGSSTANTQGTG